MNISSRKNAPHERGFLSRILNYVCRIVARMSPAIYWFNSLFVVSRNRDLALASSANPVFSDFIAISPRARQEHPPKKAKLANQAHELPPLRYGTNELEPFIDERTLHLHHAVHHASYIDGLNSALDASPHLRGKTPEWLLLHLDEVPIRVRSKVRDFSAGHLNHSMMWRSMTPNLQRFGRENVPTGVLAEAINLSFGSFEEFKTRFEKAGTKLHGSGWIWLLFNGPSSLKLMTTSGDANPITQGFVPLLAVDIWEHAYYLKYLNRRDKYLRAWWSVTNWVEIETKYDQALRSNVNRSF